MTQNYYKISDYQRRSNQQIKLNRVEREFIYDQEGRGNAAQTIIHYQQSFRKIKKFLCWISDNGDRYDKLTNEKRYTIGGEQYIYLFERRDFDKRLREFLIEIEEVNEVTVATYFRDYRVIAYWMMDQGYIAQRDIIIKNVECDIKEVYTEEEIKKLLKRPKPVGTLVNYSDKEIRIMCPADTQWVKQNVGSTGNANMYYIGFRAYAPEDAVSFKEGTSGVIEDEMFTFDHEFAGTDEYGRNYSIVWLPVAKYDEATDTWTYYGASSSAERYIGWNYVVEWYNADGVVIASDAIRINISNEACHSSVEPYYLNSAVKTANAYTDEQIANAITVVSF